MTDDHIRAGDADRELIAARLRDAVDEGRLTLLEYDERLQQLYAAKTYGELAPILVDLPAPQSAANARPVVRRPRPPIPTWVAIMWTPWVAVNVLCLIVWAATGAGYFWPFWVAVPWGCALGIPTAIGMITARPHEGEPPPRSIEQ